MPGRIIYETTMWYEPKGNGPYGRWELRLGETRGGWRFLGRSSEHTAAQAQAGMDIILRREGLERIAEWELDDKGMWRTKYRKANLMISP